jgi:hypothetical protein
MDYNNIQLNINVYESTEDSRWERTVRTRSHILLIL